MYRKQSVQACDGSVDAALQPKRFLAKIGVRATLDRYPGAFAIMKVVMTRTAQQKLVVDQLPARHVELFAEERMRNRAICDPRFALHLLLGWRLDHSAGKSPTAASFASGSAALVSPAGFEPATY